MRRLLQISVLFFTTLFFISCDSITNSPKKSAEDVNTVEQHVTAAHLPQQAGLNKALAEVRSATAKYQNVEKAESDGYVQFSIHVPGMGIHYLNDSAFNSDGTSNLDKNLNREDPEILVYVDDDPQSPQRRLVAAEYAVPVFPDNEEGPPAEALDLFPGLDEHDWHVHPSSHELPLDDSWTIHGECHYEGGLGVFLAEDPNGDFVLWTPPTGAFGSWSGTVEPAQCPSSLGGNPLPPLLLAHGKWWTLHAWVWYDNPEGVFHPTNPRVNPGQN